MNYNNKNRLLYVAQSHSDFPSKWANKSDTASSNTGLIGIFFMALTLAIVSFSCTGPILGSVLANSLTNGPWPITADKEKNRDAPLMLYYDL